MARMVNIHEAKTHFSKLLARVQNGEEVIIAHAGKPVARLVPMSARPADRQPGSAAGQIVIQPNFDDPLPVERCQRMGDCHQDAGGRLTLPDTPARYLPRQLAANTVETLPTMFAHALRVCELPPLHPDPFDRMLVVQCQVENLPILTADPLLSQYQVEIFW